MLKPLLVALALAPLPAVAADWSLEPATSVTVDVGWQGRTVAVRFPTLSGQIDFDKDHPERARARIDVAAGDATAGLGVVDALVRSRDYLGADQYPTISFELDKLTQTSKNTATIAGSMTLRGVTKPVTFDAKVTAYGPAASNPAQFEAGFDLTGSVDRTAFGSTGGLPDVAAVLPVKIHLLMISD